MNTYSPIRLSELLPAAQGDLYRSEEQLRPVSTRQDLYDDKDLGYDAEIRMYVLRPGSPLFVDQGEGNSSESLFFCDYTVPMLCSDVLEHEINGYFTHRSVSGIGMQRCIHFETGDALYGFAHGSYDRYKSYKVARNISV